MIFLFFAISGIIRLLIFIHFFTKVRAFKADYSFGTVMTITYMLFGVSASPGWHFLGACNFSFGFYFVLEK